MKKTITSLMLGLFAFTLSSQTIVSDFESFTLTPNSFYKDTNSVPFQTTSALFRHKWTNGQYPYWSGGFSYTNINDSTNGTFTNLYGCRAYKGYNNSAKYVTGQDHGIIVVKAPFDRLDGFYITNSTYAFKVLKNGDGQFAKKFGGPTGNDPDWFKITAKGYLNGIMKTDSAEFYLADYRFTNNSSDYIVENWQWFNTSNLGEIDSVKFFMYSTDVGTFGINTPLFYSMDNVTITDAYVGLEENSLSMNLDIFPNPSQGILNIQTNIKDDMKIFLLNIDGKELATHTIRNGSSAIDISWLQSGIYFIEIKSGGSRTTKKLIKN